MQAYKFGVRQRRIWSLLILSVCTLLTLISALMAYEAWPAQIVGAVLALTFSALMVFGALRGLRTFLTPPLMFEFSEDGIRSWLQKNNYDAAPLLIPWRDIYSVQLVKRRSAGSTSSYCWSLSISTATPEGIPSERSHGGSDDPQILYLDALSGNINRDKLLSEALRALNRFNPNAGPD